MTALVALIWAGVALIALWRGEKLAYAWLARTDPKAHDPQVVLIPDDLEALVLEESEIYAQQSVREVIRERYADLNNWNKVRHAMGIGEID